MEFDEISNVFESVKLAPAILQPMDQGAIWLQILLYIKFMLIIIKDSDFSDFSGHSKLKTSGNDSLL